MFWMSIFEKRQNFLYKRQSSKQSRSSSWQIYLYDVPRMAHVIDKLVLCWMDSTFEWKKLLKAWS